MNIFKNNKDNMGILICAMFSKKMEVIGLRNRILLTKGESPIAESQSLCVRSTGGTGSQPGNNPNPNKKKKSFYESFKNILKNIFNKFKSFIELIINKHGTLIGLILLLFSVSLSYMIMYSPSYFGFDMAKYTMYIECLV